jgi:hypothetical protein
VRNYLVCRKSVIDQTFFYTIAPWTLASHSLALTCNNDFEGGGWALVRRVKKGSTWFAASDNLRGTAVYGLQNSRVNDNSAFSIPYSTNVWAGTEFLFMIGTYQITSVYHIDHFALLLLKYTGDKFLITIWDSIFAGGSFYAGVDRTVTKSSASSSSCIQTCLLASDPWPLTKHHTDTTKWWNSKNDPSHPALYMYDKTHSYSLSLAANSVHVISGPGSQEDLV